MRTAIIFGATGLVGAELIRELSLREEYSKIIAVIRKPGNIQNSKVTELLCDFSDYRELQSLWLNADVFCAIGTTKAKTPKKDEYFKIDYGIPVSLAKESKSGGANSLHIVSAMGANPKSAIFYNATKGKMEEDCKRFGPKYTVIYRPSLIMGDRSEKRILEKFSQKIFKSMETVVPKKYKGVEANQIAKAMIYCALFPGSESIVSSATIPLLAESL